MLRQTCAKAVGLKGLINNPQIVAAGSLKLSTILGEAFAAPAQSSQHFKANVSPFTTSAAVWQQPKPQETEEEPELPKPASETAQPGQLQAHPSMDVAIKPSGKDTYWLMQPVYTKDYVLSVTPKHIPPSKFHEYTGYYAVQSLRSVFDYFTGYSKQMNEKSWLARFIYLETVAGVPGMVGAMVRHLRSLRTMKRDGGWIHTLLEEAENERMHLLTFLQLRNPGPVFRAAVLGGQAVFLSLYSIFYMVAPRHCHSFVGYLEEEAVKTYTRAINDLDSGALPDWTDRQAPNVAKKYWKLGDDATMKDLLLAVRADEACHQHVNATFAKMKPNEPNPFAPGTTVVQ